MIRRAAFILLLASAIVPATPRLIAAVHAAFASLGHRRQVDALTQAARALPRRVPLAFILRDTRDVDVALLADYDLYPVRSRVYASLDDWRAHPWTIQPPPLFVYCDHTAARPLTPETYETIRAQEIGGRFLVRDFGPLESGTDFVVPVVGSIDGPPPSRYTTEGLMRNGGTTAATVKLDFEPQGVHTTLTLAPGQGRTFVDLVEQEAHSLTSGYLHVSASAPIEASFFFVNRGLHEIRREPMVLSDHLRAIDLAPGMTLRAVNTTSSAVETPVHIGPHDVASAEVPPGRYEAPQGVFLFGVHHEPSGPTRFQWP